jgi:hypothetical protein
MPQYGRRGVWTHEKDRRPRGESHPYTHTLNRQTGSMASQEPRGRPRRGGGAFIEWSHSKEEIYRRPQLLLPVRRQVKLPTGDTSEKSTRRARLPQDGRRDVQAWKARRPRGESTPLTRTKNATTGPLGKGYSTGSQRIPYLREETTR